MRGVSELQLLRELSSKHARPGHKPLSRLLWGLSSEGMASASDDHLDIPLLSSSSVAIVRRCAPLLLDLVRTRFGCEAQILGLDQDQESPGSRARVVPEKRLEVVLPSGVKVSVWRADLTGFSAAAIVNAANSRLQHYGGLALALSEAGGAQVQQESDKYISDHGELRTGEAVALGPGRLKCKTIIHAVGPRLSFRPNAHEVSAARKQLECAIRQILNIVEKQRLETVAIPAISSGIFNFPVSECADTIVNTIKTFNFNSNRFKPSEIFLVNNDDPTVTEMERACRKHLLQSKSYGQVAAPARHQSQRKTQHKTSTVPPRGLMGPIEVQLGAVRLLLIRGRLEEEKVDVIVNTIGTDRNLSSGLVSKALLHKAGRNMQTEIKSAPWNRGLYVTWGHGLDCKEVHHICCPLRSSSGSVKTLFESVLHSLRLAQAAGHASIAFPAIGTGVLDFPNQEAAQIMMNAVCSLAMSTTLPLEVHLVIFPSDGERFKAFEAEVEVLRLKNLQPEQRPDPAEAAPGLSSKPDLHSSLEQEPCVRLQSPLSRSRAEAEAWLHGLLHNNGLISIKNNLIQLLGESDLQELEQTKVEGVRVEELLEKGRSILVVMGERPEDMALTALKLQLMLQKVQKRFLKEEVEELRREAQHKVKMERTPLSSSEPQLRRVLGELDRRGLRTLKVERVENPALEKLFLQQKDLMPSSSSQQLLQLVPAQFHDLVCHVGLRPECAPPDDSSLGEGLYFAEDVPTALRLWTERSDQFLYLFVVEVLKGKSGRGKPGLVLAPGQDSGPGSEASSCCDSVEESGVSVIFSHRQVLPRFMITISKGQGETGSKPDLSLV